jgi:hypothetical protein
MNARSARKFTSVNCAGGTSRLFSYYRTAECALAHASRLADYCADVTSRRFSYYQKKSERAECA